MITGLQIRAARHLLGWASGDLSVRANVPASAIRQAELADGARGITPLQAGGIRQAFERAGIRFGQNGAVMMVER